MTKINNDTRDEVKRLALQNISNVQIGRALNISEGSVRNILKEQGVKKSGDRGGRPEVLSDKEKRLVLREFENARCTTAQNGVVFVKNQFDKTLSVSYIKNLLHKNGFRSYTQKKMPLLSSKNVKARKKFHIEHNEKTFDAFKNYIFTDESSYELIRVKGGLTFYKKPNPLKLRTSTNDLPSSGAEV